MSEYLDKQTVEQHLYQKIVPFWNKTLDPIYGGFYGRVSNNLEIEPFTTKGAVQLSRILWSYSALYNYHPQKEFLDLANLAFSFLKTYLWDQEHQGLFWSTTYDGIVFDSTKHIYAQAFAIYGLTEFYLASKDTGSLELALQLYEVIEQKAYNPKNNSYWESFNYQWEPNVNKHLSSETVKPVYTSNLVIHLVEAYTNLYRVAPSKRLKQSVEKLLQCFYERIYQKDMKSCYLFFDQDWKVMDKEVSYGHDIETSWLFDLTFKELQIESADYQKMTIDLAITAFQNGYYDGYFYSERRDNQMIKEVVWWVQAEVMIGLLNLAKKTGYAEYLKAVKKTWDITMKEIVDQRDGGEWFWSTSCHIGNMTHGMSEEWKANYHNIRACLEIMKRS